MIRAAACIAALFSCAPAFGQGALAGTWTQDTVTCEAGVVPTEKVRELEFKGDDFYVTFFPFETYRDYWGKAALDQPAGTLALTTKGGNWQPRNLQLSGLAAVDQGRLVLDGFDFGEPGTVPQPGAARNCRYVFKRR